MGNPEDKRSVETAIQYKRLQRRMNRLSLAALGFIVVFFSSMQFVERPNFFSVPYDVALISLISVMGCGVMFQGAKMARFNLRCPFCGGRYIPKSILNPTSAKCWDCNRPLGSTGLY